jgi:hypothetical protein
LALLIFNLRLEPGEHAQGLRIAFESADARRLSVELFFTVVTKWRVPQIVRQPGYFDQVRITAEGITEFAGDLGDFEGVGEPGAREIVHARDHDLSFCSQPAQAH